MLKLANIFQDGAVLQQKKKIRIFGVGDQKEVKASLTSHGHLVSEASGKRLEDGRFLIVLPAIEAGTGLKLTVEDGSDKIEISDIAVGEVFLAGGQSNMEFLMKYEADRECVLKRLKEEPDEDIRYFEVPKISYEGQLQDEDHSDEGMWRKADEDNILYFSAVGYYFAAYLKRELGNVPVGIIGCTWGGSSAAAWLDESYINDKIQPYYDLRHLADGIDYEADFARFKENRKRERSQENQQRMDDFMTHSILEPIHFEIPEETHQFFMRTKYAPFSQFRPCGLYHTMLKTVIPYTLAGFLWYQGEEDCITKEYDYTALQAVLIHCWRDAFYEELPFILAQLPIYKNQGGWNGLDYVPIRRQQEEVTKQVKRTYMAVTVDKGLPYEIHPKEKRDIGERMALLALGHIYGKPIICESPEAVGAKTGKGQIRILMAHAENGLVIHGPQTTHAPELTDESLREAFDILINGERVIDFQVAVEDEEVIVSTQKIKLGSRVKVGYGQKGVFCACLYSMEGLPVRPFVVEL